jgi:hypothetical protein
LIHLEETPAQKLMREEMEMGDFIMRAGSGQTFSEAEIERIRI